MVHYSNIIFFLVQLLFVHCDDLNSNYIYQKLLTTRFRLRVPNISRHLPIRKKTIELYSNILSQPEITSTSARNDIQNYNSNYFKKIQEDSRVIQDFNQRQKAMQEFYRDPCLYETGTEKKCSSTKRCGSYRDRRKRQRGSRNNGGDANIMGDVFLIILGLLFGLCILCGMCVWCNVACCSCDGGRSNNPAINNYFNQQMLQISTESMYVPMNSMTLVQDTENHRLPLGGPQRLIRTTSPINSIVSTEPHLSENNDSNDRRATPSSLPTYDDIMRQSSETITIEQQSLLLPTYNDFMRRNN